MTGTSERSWRLAGLAAVGGAGGSVLRWGLASFGGGILFANVIGSFVLGVVLGREERRPGDSVPVLVGAGWCGGLTTFSTFAVQLDELRWTQAAIYAVASVATALTAFVAGRAAARQLA